MSMSRQSHRRSARPTGGPGRRERHRAEMRDRLYHAALRLFAQRGYLETTVEDITEAADVGKGTFFNYFPTKEHVLGSFGDERLALIERAVEKSQHGRVTDAIRGLFVEQASRSGETPALLRAIFVAHGSSEPVRAKLQKRMVAARQLIAQMFALAQQRGEVRTDIPADQLGWLTHLIFFGVTLAWTMHPDSSLPEAVKSAWEIIWPGLKKV
jgi:AcrR family transcriptional regulator